MRRFSTLLTALAAILVAGPATAHAAQLSLAAGTVTYSDTDPNAKNILAVKLSADGKTLTFTETGRSGRNTIPIAGNGSCTTSKSTGSCPATGVTLVDIGTGDQDDAVTVTANIATRLSGGNGNDRLTGGTGDDLLRGEAGADTLTGGAGTDTADYSDRVNPVTVTLDGTAGDGEAGENDNDAADIENILGGSAADTLTGNALDNQIAGGNGNDTLSGLGGNDRLDGSANDDRIDGGDGADTIIGGDGTDTADYTSAPAGVHVSLNGQADDGRPGEGDSVDTESVFGSAGDDVLVGNAAANVLQGGAGNDRILGGAGADALDGGPGDDIIETLDGVVDAVVCGEGTDGVVSDRKDVRTDCEYIKYRVLQASSTAVHVSGGAVRIPVRCIPAVAEACRGRAALKLGSRTLGTRTFHLTPGRRWVAKITLTRSARALVAKRKLVSAQLVIRNRDSTGVTNTTRQTIRVGA